MKLESFECQTNEDGKKIVLRILVETETRYATDGSVEPVFVLAISRSDQNGGGYQKKVVNDATPLQAALTNEEDVMSLALIDCWDWAQELIPESLHAVIEAEELGDSADQPSTRKRVCLSL